MQIRHFVVGDSIDFFFSVILLLFTTPRGNSQENVNRTTDSCTTNSDPFRRTPEMWKSLFGFGEDDGKPLVNEPTIDYDNTILTRKSPTVRQSSFTRTPLPNYTSPPQVIDLSDDDLDYDQDLIDQVNIFNNVTRSLTSRSKFSFPDNYPGKFPATPSGNDNFQRHHFDDHRNDQDRDDLNIESTIDLDPKTHNNTKANSASKTKQQLNGRNLDKELYDSTIDRKLAKLQNEVNQEFKTSIDNQKIVNNDTTEELKQLRKTLESQTEYLVELAECVKLYGQEQNDQDSILLPHDIKERYEDVKTDLKKKTQLVEFLYGAYYRLVKKHVQYVKKHRGTTLDKSTPVAKSTVSMREKIKSISSKTKDISIKNMCGKVLSDLSHYETKYAELLTENEKLRKEKEQLLKEKEELVKQLRETKKD